MARRVFFSFHFERDIFRANQVRNANVVVGPDVAGFFDHSEYEEARKKGDEAIRRMILRHLDRTSVTVVLIGRHTASRPWVRYEIAESVKRKNGLLGIYIDHLWAPGDPLPSALAKILGPMRTMPPKPVVLPGIEFPAYDWDGDVRRFARAIEQAGQRSDRLRQPPPFLFRPTFPPRRFN